MLRLRLKNDLLKMKWGLLSEAKVLFQPINTKPGITKKWRLKKDNAGIKSYVKTTLWRDLDGKTLWQRSSGQKTKTNGEATRTKADKNYFNTRSEEHRWKQLRTRQQTTTHRWRRKCDLKREEVFKIKQEAQGHDTVLSSSVHVSICDVTKGLRYLSMINYKYTDPDAGSAHFSHLPFVHIQTHRWSNKAPDLTGSCKQRAYCTVEDVFTRVWVINHAQLMQQRKQEYLGIPWNL